MSKEAIRNAVAKYDKNHTTGLYVKLNLSTDADIIEYLSRLNNKNGTIKRLIRQEIARSRQPR